MGDVYVVCVCVVCMGYVYVVHMMCVFWKEWRVNDLLFFWKRFDIT